MSGGRIGRLDVRAHVFVGPPEPRLSAERAPEDAALVVGLRSSRYVLLWRRGADDLSSVEASSIADLPDRIGEGWAKNGAHRDKSDRTLDLAFVFLPNDVDYAGTIAVVDAIASATRTVSNEHAGERVPAMRVTLGVPEEIPPGKIDSPIGGRLPPEVIQRIVRQNYGFFRGCYERGLARNRDLIGSVRVRFTIERDGTVSHVADDGNSTMPDTEVVRCIHREYAQIRFPHPEGGTVTVVYPIVFRPGD
jgi:hypothetical protein